MKRAYKVVIELDISLKDDVSCRVSYFENGKLLGDVQPYREYVDNKMEIDVVDVNTLRIAFAYVCKMESEIKLELIKLRAKNRFCQNLIKTNQNGLMVRLADKVKAMAIEEGYDTFMANALRLKLLAYSDDTNMNNLLKIVDTM